MAQTIDIIMPEDSQEGTTATVSSWHFKVGDQVAEHAAIAELETDKVNVEVPAPASGRLIEIIATPGTDVAPGGLLGRMEVGASGEASAAPVAAEATAPKRAAKSPRDSSGQKLLSPAVRRLLQEHQLDAEAIEGTGKGGRITKQDVLAFLEQPHSAPSIAKRKPNRDKAPATTTPISVRPAPVFDGVTRSRMVPHDKMRRSIASHMVHSLMEAAPHVTAVFEMDMSAVIRHRKAHKNDFAQSGIGLTYTAYFVMAVAEAIKAVPDVNSRWHDDALEIFEDYNIGVGTALGDKGLIVPVIHQAQNLGLRGIAERLTDVTNRARIGKLSPSDVKGGTFTISNHGVSGSLLATPIIINQPQSAILGIGKLQKRVVVVENESGDAMQIRPMCYVTLSIDHRCLDAWHTNTFLSRFVEVIENWQ